MTYTERSFAIDGIPVAYIEGGAGLPVLLIHGSGPGASTQGNWRTVLEPLAKRFHVFAMDLIGFGKSGRKPAPPFFDVDLWVRQARALIELMPAGDIGIIGHSLSGALGLKLAASEPRVAKLLTTGSLGASFPLTQELVGGWSFPKDREALRQVAQSLVFDGSQIDDTYLAAREQVLFADPTYARYFEAMFSGDKQRYIEAAVLSPDELSRIACPVTMVHGRDDLLVPPSVTLDIAAHIPQADVALLARCSHSVALEQTAKLLAAIDTLFETPKAAR